jgi:hypothetical protein
MSTPESQQQLANVQAEAIAFGAGDRTLLTGYRNTIFLSACNLASLANPFSVSPSSFIPFLLE